MKKLAKNYVYNILYQIFILSVAIITAPYLTRVLGATNMGTYSYISSFSSVISTLSLLGIYNYGVRQLAYVREDKKKFNQTFWEIILIRIILAILGSMVYFVASKEIYRQYVILYFPWLIAGYIDLSWLFVATENMGPAILKNFFAKLITIIGIFVFVKSKNQVWIYILISALSTLLANISLIPQVKKYVSRPNIDIKNLKKHFSGTILLFLPQIASLMYLQIDKIMLEGLVGNLNQISFYDQAEKIIKIPTTFITVMNTVIMPRMANEYKKGNTKKIENYVFKVSRFSLFLALPMIVGIVVIVRQFIPWYLGSEYNPTIIALLIISPIILSQTLTGVSGSQYFVATNQMKIVIWSNVIGAVLNVSINAILIPKYEFIGAAIASVIASYSITIVQFIKINKVIKVKKILKYLPKYFFNSAVMGLIVYFISCDMSISPWTTIIQILGGVCIYILLLIIERDTLIFYFFKLVKKSYD